MEIPRSIRYAFSSPEGRRRMKERKDIIQGMSDTIISHSPPPQISLYTQPDKSKPVLYRGTLSGWVVMGSLRQDPVLTSGYSYHTDVAAKSPPCTAMQVSPPVKKPVRNIVNKFAFPIELQSYSFQS